MSSETIYTFPKSKKQLDLLSQEEKNQIFINMSRLKHGDKYDYSLVHYIKTDEKVKIICPTHGIFEQKPNGHLSGYGCIKCCGNQLSSTKEFIEKSTHIHGDKFNYDLVEYIDCDTNINILCNKHNYQFNQTPYRHLRTKYACPKCRAENSGKSQKLTTEIFIEKSKLKHGDRYDYSKSIFKNTLTKVEIICKEHGSFWQLPSNHYYRGDNCPYCRVISSSNNSQEWLDSLNISHLIREHKISEHKNMPVDGYDPTTNTIYQFHGKYWHSDPRVQDMESIHGHLGITHRENYTNSNKKDQQLLDLGYNLVVMWEYDWELLKNNKNGAYAPNLPTSPFTFNN